MRDNHGPRSLGEMPHGGIKGDATLFLMPMALLASNPVLPPCFKPMFATLAVRTSISNGPLLPDLTIAISDPFVGRQVGRAHRAARM